MTNQTGSCAGVYGRPECVSSTWFAHVTFSDTGEGLLSITSRENPNGTLTGKKNQFRATGERKQRDMNFPPPGVRLILLLLLQHRGSHLRKCLPSSLSPPLVDFRRFFHFVIPIISFPGFGSLLLFRRSCYQYSIDSEKTLRQ